jgi:hypothetical protein
MSIFPKGERVRSAIRWISEHLKEDPSRAVIRLAQEAAVQFDLTPKESEELIQFYRSARERENDAGT